jgi:methyl-accepting chemotaxis protein
MQIERTAYSFAVMPETKALLGDVQRFSYVGSAADRLVATLPETLSKERKELIAQLMSELEMRREALGELTEDLRATLAAGTDTANALHATLESLDRITARFAAKPGTTDSKEKGPPFDIREYTEMVRELAITTRELNALAGRVDSSLPAVHQATESAATRIEQLTSYLFWRLVLLLVIAVALITAAALGYRVILARMRGSPT